MSGIRRFRITDATNGRGGWRFTDSRKCWPSANAIYRNAFASAGLPLEPGYEETECTKSEFEAGYDYQLGIDVVLRGVGGQEFTMQEKFLFTSYDTVTVEYMQDWRNNVPGDWFNLKCQFYFVGYDYPKDGRIKRWVLLDWTKTMLATGKNRLRWLERPNKEDGARASFKYVHFADLPSEVVVARS
jgi:hypothetical protein